MEKPRSFKTLVTKSKITQESCQDIRENPRISGKKREVSRFPVTPSRNPNHNSSGRKSKINGIKIYKHPKVDQIVVGYGFQSQTKFVAISNHNPYIEFGGSQLVEPFKFHVTGLTMRTWPPKGPTKEDISEKTSRKNLKLETKT